MARNLYAGRRYCCGAYVPVGYGHFERHYNPDPKGARWRHMLQCRVIFNAWMPLPEPYREEE